MEIVKFMGFKFEIGFVVYKFFFLSVSGYIIFGLLRKVEVWRFFCYILSDYYWKVIIMSILKFIMKIVGYGLKVKVIFDLMSID